MTTELERTATRYPRLLPGVPTRCDRCGDQIVWAVTATRQRGSGGKAMPLDLVENFGGNVAVTTDQTARLIARVLRDGETADLPSQFIAQSHLATCKPRRRGR